MLYLVLITLIIIVLYNNYTYKEENNRLKKQIQESGKKEDNIIEKKERVKANDKISGKSYKKNDEGIKNKFMLMTGAVFIVLSAIVFLTSTWDTIPNIIKTIVIVLLGGVFLVASSISRKIFKLEETANTFLYISLAYLPISLYSISFFGLLGEFFSIYGQGCNLYLAVSSILVAIVYFIVGNKRIHKVIFNSSMIMQLISVIFISKCINIEMEMLILCINIYNIFINMVKNTLFKNFTDEINKYNKLYIYFSMIIQILLLLEGPKFIGVISNVLIIYNLYINYKNYPNSKNIVLLLLQFFVFSISAINISNIVWEIRRLLIFCVFIAVYLKGILSKDEKWKESSILVSTIALILFYIVSIFDTSKFFILKNSFIIWTITILNIVSYKVLEIKRKKFLINLTLICLFISEIHTLIEFDLNINYLIYASLVIFVVSTLNIIKDQNIKLTVQKYANVMTIISFSLASSLNNNMFFNNTLIFAMIMLVYLFAYIKNQNNETYKILGYLMINLVIYSILKNFDLLGYNRYILFITTIIICLIEKCNKEVQSEISEGYIILSYICSAIVLNFSINIAAFICLAILGVVYSLYIKDTKVDDILKIIPFFTMIPSIYFSKIAYLGEINFMVIIGFFTLTILTLLSIKEKKINIFTKLSIIYLFFQILRFDLNSYINLAVTIIWSVMHLAEMEKDKNKFKLVIYISSLILYNKMIKDISANIIDIGSIIAFRYFGYIVTTVLISRTILKEKNKSGYKLLEYLVLSIIYIFAIFKYNSQLDGMFFVTMLVMITIFSYLKKLGPVFFTSTVAILINIFLLTKEFWFSTPWWVYMIFIGGVLITFAINNEINENKQRKKLKSKVKEFKDYIDM